MKTHSPVSKVIIYSELKEVKIINVFQRSPLTQPELQKQAALNSKRIQIAMHLAIKSYQNLESLHHAVYSRTWVVAQK